jgi:RNA polymerase sigma-70 factor (ECF subfamily)
MASSTDPAPAEPGPAHDTTSLHLRRAVDGDTESLSWLVSRLSAPLIAQARYRMGPQLRLTHDPEDIVSEVWMITLPRLRDLAPRTGRYTPLILKFLSTVLLHRVNRLVRRHLVAGRRDRLALPESGSDGLHGPTDTSNGVVTSVVRREMQSLVLRRLDDLDPQDREVIILRSIEQRSGDEVGRLLGIPPSAVYVRHHRALNRLRECLPDSVFGELEP